MTTGLELSVPFLYSSNPKKIEGLGVESLADGQWFKQSCLYNEASLKSQNDEVQRSSVLVASHTRRVAHSSFYGDSSSCAQNTFGPHPMYLFTWLFICIYIISWQVQVNVFLWVLWASRANKLNLRKGSWEPPIYSQLVWSTASNLGLQLGSQVGSFVRLSPQPAGYDLVSCR